MYGYVGNSPNNYFDPYGLFGFDSKRFRDEVDQRRWRWSLTGPNIVNHGGGAFRYPRSGTGKPIGSPSNLMSTLGSKFPVKLPVSIFNTTNLLRAIGRVSTATLIWEGFWDLGIIIEAGVYAIDWGWDGKPDTNKSPCEK